MTEIYYDRFSSDKQWDKVLFRSGKVLQSAELNELQSLFDDKLKKLGDVFISDGSVISGCSVIPPGNWEESQEVKISSGFVYVKGKIIYTDEQTVSGTLTGDGIELIYIDVEEEIITEAGDTTLNDPAIEEPNFGLPGAHRQILTLKFYAEDEKTATSIVFDKLYDGGVLFKRPNFGGDKIVNVMAGRTAEIDGDFLVDGAGLKLNAHPEDSTKFYVQVEPFQSYLKGQERDTLLTQSAVLDKATAYYETQDLIPVGQASDDYSPLTANVFDLHTPFLKQVTTLLYPVRTTQTITHGGSGGTDSLGLGGSLAKVLAVSQNSTEYTLNDDYTVNFVSGSINWSPGGAEPQVGSSYEVDCVWYRTITVVLDDPYPAEFSVEYLDEAVGSFYRSQLTILDSEYYSSDTTLVVNIEYVAFKKRRDAVVLDVDTGLMQVISGDYAEYADPTPAPRVTNNHFVLYLIDLNPGDYYDPSSYTVVDKKVYRITQKGVNKLEDQVRLMQENFMFTTLDQDALSTPVGGMLNGVFTDALDSQDKQDTAFQTGDGFTDAYNAGFDDSSLSLPLVINTERRTPTVLSSSLKTCADVYCLPFTEEVIVSQALATGVMSLQPYALPRSGAYIELSPNNDVWVETGNVTVWQQDSTILAKQVTQPVNTIRENPLDPASRAVQQRLVPGKSPGTPSIESIAATALGNNPSLARASNITSGQPPLAGNQRIEPLGVNTTNTVIPFIRQRSLRITGKGWYVPGTVGNWRLGATIGGVNIPEVYSQARINSDYEFDVTVTIPAGVPMGVAEVRVWTIPEYMEASSVYHADGTLQVETRINRVVTLPPPPPPPVVIIQQVTPPPAPQPWGFNWLMREPVTSADPIAQAIMPELVGNDFFLSSVGVYFSAKDSTEPVYCLVAEMVNGYPSRRFLGWGALTASQVSTSNNASVETKFTLNNPVLMEKNKEYAIVIRSLSANYLVWYAKQGETDVTTSKKVIAQPYLGVFFTSANLSTWTAEQDSRLKFNLYRANFSSSGTLTFAQQAISDSYLMVLADYVEHGGSDCYLEYQTGDQSWSKYPFGRKQLLSSGAFTTACQLRLQMGSSNNYMSPMFKKELGTLYFKYEREGFAYTNRLDFGEENAFDRVKIRIAAASMGVPFEVNIAASNDATTWYSYSSSTPADMEAGYPKSSALNLNFGVYEYEYLFDISDHFSGMTLARYLRINIHMGDDSETYSTDSPRIFDLRAVVYENIA